MSERQAENSNENTPFSTPILSPELREQVPTETPTNITTDCDTNVRETSNEEDDVVCGNETVVPAAEEDGNQTEETSENAQETNVNRNASQETVESEVNGADTGAETELQAGVESLALNDTESNGVVDEDTRTEIEEITFGRERTITEETGDGSGESLTFDENHFSTPTGGATPERRASTSRRRRATASSMEDSEVRSERVCGRDVYCVKLLWVVCVRLFS